VQPELLEQPGLPVLRVQMGLIGPHIRPEAQVALAAQADLVVLPLRVVRELRAVQEHPLRHRSLRGCLLFP